MNGFLGGKAASSGSQIRNSGPLVPFTRPSLPWTGVHAEGLRSRTSMDTDELPSFQLTELVDELARSSDEEGLDVEVLTPNTKMVRDMASDPEVVKITPLPAPAKRDEGGPSSDRSAGERIASAFWRCAHEAGFTMLCEALTFTGLRDELPRLMAPGHTIMAPTNEAWAKMDESVRKDPRLVRQLLLGHMCAGISTLQDLRQRLRPLRPALPASSAHLRRDVQLGFRRRLRRRRPRLGVPPGPRPTACGPTNRHML